MATRSRQQLEAEIRAIADLKRNLSPAERQRLGALANQLAGVVGKPITVHRSVSGPACISVDSTPRARQNPIRTAAKPAAPARAPAPSR